MHRRVTIGLLAICCAGLGAGLFAPLVASAAKQQVTCATKLEDCTDEAITSYDDCICSVPGALACLKEFATAPAGPAATSVAACTTALQDEILKCQVADALCTLASKAPGRLVSPPSAN